MGQKFIRVMIDRRDAADGAYEGASFAFPVEDVRRILKTLL